MSSARAARRGTKEPPGGAREGAFDVGDLVALLSVAAACVLTLGRVVGHPFVNWDDPQALVQNPALDAPGLWAWAFSTTHMSHYQPFAWLFWGGLRRAFGIAPGTHHAASLAGHALNATLVFLLARRISAGGGPDGRNLRLASVTAALVFGLHPLRVEVVAWASALPYVLALTGLLSSLLLYLREADARAGAAAVLAPAFAYGASLAAYAVSLLCRPLALGFPLVLLGLEAAWRRGGKRALVRVAPFAVLAAAAFALEAGARPFVGWERVGLGPRLSAAASAPLVYLARELAPIRLSPLDVAAIEPRTSWLALAAGGGFLVAAALLAVKLRRERPFAVLAGATYLVLLAPAMGFAPSGLQATADRYTYLPDVALALLVGAGVGGAAERRRFVIPAGIAAAVLLGGLSSWQAGFWRDSVALWTRAAELDPRNDVALYNLALALREAGDPVGAERQFRETLVLVPEHAPARKAVAALEARRLEEEAGRRAAAGKLEEAISLLDQALAKEPGRMRPHASRGMALAERGRCAEAIHDLRAALDLGNREVEVASGLAFCLLRTGRGEEALRTAEETVAAHPDDPRVFGALATLQAQAGRLDLAALSARRGSAVARRLGNLGLAQGLEAEAIGYERKSPGRLSPGAR